MHPECQKRVYEEVSSVLGHTQDASFTREQIDKLCYTERCIRETMRYIPIVPMIARTNRAPIKLRNIVLPVGTQIAIAITKLHQSAEHWGNDVGYFKPERFEPENIAKVHPYAYLAFSGGPRNCIGKKTKHYFVFKFIMLNISIIHRLQICNRNRQTGRRSTCTKFRVFNSFAKRGYSLFSGYKCAIFNATSG